MNDVTAVPCEARDLPAGVSSGLIADAKGFVSGLLFTAAIAVAGTFLVALTLVVGVVGSPVVAAVATYLVIRHRREARARAWPSWTSLAS